MDLKDKTEFEQILEARKYHWQDSTAALLQTAESSIVGIEAFLQDVPQFSGCSMEWNAVNIMGDEEDPMIEFAGSIIYEPGSVFTHSTGEQVVVTEGTAEYFTRSIAIRLPLILITDGSTADVIMFLENIEADKVRLPPSTETETEELEEVTSIATSGGTEEEHNELFENAVNKSGVLH